MIEFAESIGYTNSTKINTFRENNCSVDSIEKIYDIDGINAKVQKEYIGRVVANTCDSIKIMTCGGFSATLDDIGINIYTYDFEKKKYNKVKFESITENERTKLIKVYFNKILSNKDKFKVKYQENHWYGAMRNKKDGIVVGEHLFFDSLSEQIITLRFSNTNNINAELYQYNFKEKKITKMETHIYIDNNICKVSIKNTSNNCVYFLMYNYD